MQLRPTSLAASLVHRGYQRCLQLGQPCAVISSAFGHPGARLCLPHPCRLARGPLPESPRDCPQIVPEPCVQPPAAVSCHRGGLPHPGHSEQLLPPLAWYMHPEHLMLPQFPLPEAMPGLQAWRVQLSSLGILLWSTGCFCPSLRLQRAWGTQIWCREGT